jgi:hypothetical protein
VEDARAGRTRPAVRQGGRPRAQLQPDWFACTPPLQSRRRPPAPPGAPVPQALAADVLARNDASFAPRPPQAQRPFGGTAVGDKLLSSPAGLDPLALGASPHDRLSKPAPGTPAGRPRGPMTPPASQTALQGDDLSAVAGMPARDGDLAVG